MSKPRKKPPARKESRGRTYTISCTDEQWTAIQDGAERAGKNVSTVVRRVRADRGPVAQEAPPAGAEREGAAPPRAGGGGERPEPRRGRGGRSRRCRGRTRGAHGRAAARDGPARADARTGWRCCAGRSATRRREPSPRRSYRTRRRRRPPRRRRARKVAGPKRRPRQRRRASCSLPTTISKRPRSPHCGGCARRVLASGPGRCRRVRPRGRGVANAGPPNTARERRSGSSPAWSDPAADAHAAAGPAPGLRQRRSRSRATLAVNSSRWRSMPLSLDPNSRPSISFNCPRRRIRG